MPGKCSMINALPQKIMPTIVRVWPHNRAFNYEMICMLKLYQFTSKLSSLTTCFEIRSFELVIMSLFACKNK